MATYSLGCPTEPQNLLPSICPQLPGCPRDIHEPDSRLIMSNKNPTDSGLTKKVLSSLPSFLSFSSFLPLNATRSVRIDSIGQVQLLKEVIKAPGTFYLPAPLSSVCCLSPHDYEITASPLSKPMSRQEEEREKIKRREEKISLLDRLCPYYSGRKGLLWDFCYSC